MTTLENRPNTALLVVDVQNGVVEGAHERDAVVANVSSLVVDLPDGAGAEGRGVAIRVASTAHREPGKIASTKNCLTLAAPP